MSQLIRQKIGASILHFLVTCGVCLLIALVVFFVWYPSPLAKFMGGYDIFFLVIACDLILGPMLSLVIYNPAKPKKELISDYALIGLIQLCALGYGMHSVAQARPMYIAFTVDRFELVRPLDIDAEDRLDSAWKAYFIEKPKYVWAKMPDGIFERSDILISSMQKGRDLQFLPKYYEELSADQPVFKKAQKSMAALKEAKPESTALIDEAVLKTGFAPENLKWMPFGFNQNYWVALLAESSPYPVGWIDLDPY